MTILNAALRALFDALQYPVRGLPPMVGVVVWSIITAVGMLVVFKRTSDQDEIAAVKRRIHACLFEIRLFNDDLRAILRAQLEILRHNASYLKLSVKPMLWMIVPLVLMISQLQYHYGYRAFNPGEQVVLKVELSPDWNGQAAQPSRPSLTVDVPAGIRLETPGVWSPALNEMAWRLAVDSWGDYELTFKLDEQAVTKSLTVSDSVVRLSPVRPARGFIGQLTWPAEDPLPKASPVRSITLDYPAAVIGAFGWDFESEWAWMVVFFVLSIVIAFILRKPFDVNI
jgi:uncharacterized membrane protein (DUF106 family)